MRQLSVKDTVRMSNGNKSIIQKIYSSRLEIKSNLIKKAVVRDEDGQRIIDLYTHMHDSDVKVGDTVRTRGGSYVTIEKVYSTSLETECRIVIRNAVVRDGYGQYLLPLESLTLVEDSDWKKVGF